VPTEGYLLAWDAGSGGMRCLIVDAQGRQVGISRSEGRFERPEDVPAGLEFDPEEMWGAFGRLTKEALGSIPPEEVLALSTTSFRDGMVFLDDDGQVLYAGTNRDARAVAQGFEMSQRHGETIYRLTGRWPVGIDGAEHLLWMRKFRPEVYERIAKVLMVNDWLVYRLCGVYSSEPTNASSSLLFDITKREWSLEVANLLDLSPSIFPPLFAPGQVAGGLSQEAAKFLGLLPGTSVVVGLADSQAACLACRALDDGDTVAIAGTTMPLQMTLAEPMLDQKHRTWTGVHALSCLWSLECSAGLAGFAYQWLWEAFGNDEAMEEPYVLLSAEAEEEPPGSAMAFMGPWIADHGRLEFQAQVGFLAPFPMMLTPPLTRPKMARAILENIAFAVRGNLAQLEEISSRKVQSLALCGGLTRAKVFNRIVADVCQIPVRVPAIKEASALGAAMCAAVGGEVYPDLDTATERMANWEEVVEPDPAMRGRYTTLYKRWLKTYHKLLGR
jgi:autoinducer 2 (AI-2) kinase